MATGWIHSRIEPVRTFDDGRQLAVIRGDDYGWFVVERSGPKSEWRKLAGPFERKGDARQWVGAQ